MMTAHQRGLVRTYTDIGMSYRYRYATRPLLSSADLAVADGAARA
jgi:hypothetical protein